MSNDERWYSYLHERTLDDTHFVLMCDARNQEWVSEAWVRTTGGLRHQVMRWHERPRITEIRAECIGTGIFTKRPYVLGQACDGSIGAPVMALYADFCRARKLDPVKLLQLAYDDESECTLESFAVTRALADWQGTTFPKRWDNHAIAGLLTSLHAINYHQLPSTHRIGRKTRSFATIAHSSNFAQRNCLTSVPRPAGPSRAAGIFLPCPTLAALPPLPKRIKMPHNLLCRR